MTGAKALRGEKEYINSIIFDGVASPRKITGRGKLIQIYDSKADMSSLAYWEHENPSEDGTYNIPARYKVRVIGSTVKFT
ncbi:uncharacterized protein BDZ99DRAFT_152914 [Mytilinidion resinicola]|uniref:Uncharacterized protein n=1 Tax=Mytilinidion resinicola TaxID=574789 RepID=A0A6A6Y914_9PEZI|nr:uncharacterized protein BDZ99DRAFT_152914 [Mytilinidion resinicola]KAF2804454.1 hypothetical protein BDZ99DRAFT_152914 [Mytilinidion resinicola]